MTITQITTYFTDAQKRLLEQYKRKPRIEALLAVYSAQYQEIENELFLMRTARYIAEAQGQQLDNFGEIVGQDRLGFNDDFYRILLYAKIGINISEGDPERIIAVFKLLTQADFVHYMNERNGNVALATDGSIMSSLYTFVYAQMERVIAGGTRITTISIFDEDNPFSLDGPNVNVANSGLGSIYDANAGGELAYIIPRGLFFGLDGGDDSLQGLSSIYDPIIGGGLATL